jgi:hypothetical protein
MLVSDILLQQLRIVNHFILLAVCTILLQVETWGHFFVSLPSRASSPPIPQLWPHDRPEKRLFHSPLIRGSHDATPPIITTSIAIIVIDVIIVIIIVNPKSPRPRPSHAAAILG